MNEMETADRPAPVVILNGAPRSGKSSIAAAVQEMDRRIWITLGVDAHMGAMMPKRLSPGIGLRPGGERPDLEPLLPSLFAGLAGAIAAHSRQGLPVISDFGLHDAYSRPLGILPLMAECLAGIPVLFVGVRCPIETIMERRRAETARTDAYVAPGKEGVPEPVRRWQAAVHRPGTYDLEVDTSAMSAEACARLVLERLDMPDTAPRIFARLAGAPA